LDVNTDTLEVLAIAPNTTIAAHNAANPREATTTR
jgi:hypothetical protein